MIRQCYLIAVNVFNFAPSEFWRMTPAEFWWLYADKMETHAGDIPKWGDMYDMLEEG